MKKTAILLGALAATAAMPALAHEYNGVKEDAMTQYIFYQMDTDHNGYVSRPEHEAFAAGMFTRADANLDGFLTYHEIQAFNHTMWNDWNMNYRTRTGAYYEGDKYYPYGNDAPTDTPNEPYHANHGKTDRSWRDYDIKKSADDYNSDPRY